eukprot:1519985-Prymnesium_polylepis.1
MPPLSQPANGSGTNDVAVAEDRTSLAALRWRRRTSSAFVSDVLRHRAAAAADPAPAVTSAESVEPVAREPPPVKTRRARQQEGLLGGMIASLPFRIAKHRLVVQPVRRCKAYLERRNARRAAWLLATVVALLERTLGLQICK